MKITLKEYNPKNKNITWVIENNTMTYREFIAHVSQAMKNINPNIDPNMFTNTIIGL